MAGRHPFNGPARPDPVPLQQLRPETDGELADTVKGALAYEPAGGTHFTLLLNGEYVAEVTDNQLGRSGAVGVVMVLDGEGDAASWEFSNLELRAPRGSQ